MDRLASLTEKIGTVLSYGIVGVVFGGFWGWGFWSVVSTTPEACWGIIGGSLIYGSYNSAFCRRLAKAGSPSGIRWLGLAGVVIYPLWPFAYAARRQLDGLLSDTARCAIGIVAFVMFAQFACILRRAYIRHRRSELPEEFD